MNNYKAGDIVVATKVNPFHLSGQVGVVKDVCEGYPWVTFDMEGGTRWYEDHQITPLATHTSLLHYADWIEGASEPLAWHDMNQIEQAIDSRAEYNNPDADPVEHPDHYTSSNIECIDYLKDNMSYEAFLGFLEGNTKKYLHRWRHKKKPVEDLKKARWYLDRLILELEGPEGS